MAFHKLQSGDFMVVGYVPKDAELKKVGNNNSSKTSFSIKASEKTLPDGKKEAQWTNCIAWHEMARICAGFKKGDVVMAVGRIESREYNGKTYKDLVVEFAVKASVPETSAGFTPASGNTAIDPADELGDLSDFDSLDPDDIPF